MSQKNHQKIKQSFDHILKDFQSNKNYSDKWIVHGNGTRILRRFDFELPKHQMVKFPFVIYLIFVELLEYPFLSRFEKVKWEIPILFKGEEFVLAHRKFGFDISSSEDTEQLRKLAIEAMTQIKKAEYLVEPLINPKIQKQVEQGSITLESKYTEIRNRYLFFRGKLEETENGEKQVLKIKLKDFKLDKFSSTQDAITAYNEIKGLKNSDSYYLYAMIDSYFSLLEHTSVLLIPFLKHINVSNLNFEEFIALNWKKKLQFILQPHVNTEAEKKIEILDEIKEQIRNPISHGYFHKKKKSFFVHMDGLGAIPFTLTNSITKFKFSDFSKEFMPLPNILRHFDDFDNFLESENTRFGIKYIKRDLPIAFDKASCTKYRRRTRTDKSTKRFIDETIKELENAINMDW